MAGILNLFFMPMICGSKVVVGERFGIQSIPRFWEYPIKHSANTFWFIPAMLALLMKLDRGTSGIEYAKKTRITGLVGTAPLNQRLRRDFEKRYGIPLYESYGLSETLFVSTNSPSGIAGGIEWGVGDGVGKPLDGVELGFREDKEISIGVPWMFLGYSNVDAKQSFSGEKFLSGDIGEFESSSGFLRITGRKKDLIIRGGINISPRRTEEFVAHSDIFDESAIIGAEDANLGEKSVCFFVPSQGHYSDNARKQLNREIVEKLGKDYQIDEFVELKEIPKNINGKIDKPKLRKFYKEKHEHGV